MTDNALSIFWDSARALRPEIVHDADRFAVALKRWLELELGRCHDSNFGVRFQKGCPVQGALPEHYLNQIIDIDGLGRVLAGIRFMGGALDRPFVDLIATEHPFSSDIDTPHVLHTLREHFARFHPRTVRVLWPNPHPPSWSRGVSANLDQVLSIGVARRSDPRAEPFGNLATMAEASSAAAALEVMYEAHFQQFPDSRRWLSPADIDELQRCVELGYLLTIPGEQQDISGVLAAEESSSLGVPGFWMIEEIIHPTYRKRGLAARGQRALIEWIATDHPGALVCGTIDSRNTASRRTAAKAGRHEVMAYLWLGEPDAVVNW